MPILKLVRKHFEVLRGHPITQSKLDLLRKGFNCMQKINNGPYLFRSFIRIIAMNILLNIIEKKKCPLVPLWSSHKLQSSTSKSPGGTRSKDTNGKAGRFARKKKSNVYTVWLTLIWDRLALLNCESKNAIYRLVQKLRGNNLNGAVKHIDTYLLITIVEINTAPFDYRFLVDNYSHILFSLSPNYLLISQYSFDFLPRWWYILTPWF